ncbi:hypothetical protein HAX54_044992 [Datura stramonium]|uniref:CRAL/TRIO N-terminal domain-containing protein n=1 Tax=Datura stramonium TaxID=4076 RepID=A0ABS8SQG8_DATST|nr:hypothetical protein [Datura stramonium]
MGALAWQVMIPNKVSDFVFGEDDLKLKNLFFKSIYRFALAFAEAIRVCCISVIIWSLALMLYCVCDPGLFLGRLAFHLCCAWMKAAESHAVKLVQSTLFVLEVCFSTEVSSRKFYPLYMGLLDHLLREQVSEKLSHIPLPSTREVVILSGGLRVPLGLGCHCDQECEDQPHKVKRLRTSLAPLSGRNLQYCNDACLRRYLEARNWNVDKSKKMMEESLKWRSSFKPEEILWLKVKQESFRANFRDRCGRTVLILRPSVELMKSYFDMDNLPTELGGKANLKYDLEFSRQMAQDDVKALPSFGVLTNTTQKLMATLRLGVGQKTECLAPPVTV